MAYTVAIYLVDRAYGGPEEGGWWYDYGFPAEEYCQYTKGFMESDAAIEYMYYLEASLLPSINEGRRPISSVLSTGKFNAIVTEGNPKPFPDTIPRYE